MLSRSVHGGIHGGHLLLAALAVLVAILAGRAWKLLSQPLPAAPVAAAALLADPQLLAGHDPFFPAASGGAAAPVTTLALSLHGVRSDSVSGRGSAIIARGDGEQKVYDVGDEVENGVRLVAIAGDHVILERGGMRESLWLDAGSDTPVQRFDPDADASDASVADSGGLPDSDAPGEIPPPALESDVPGAAVMAAVPPPGAPARPRR